MISREKHNQMANAIRFLSMDAVEKAKSGHPGLPMGAADIATVPTLRGPVVALNDVRVADMKTIPEEAWFLIARRQLRWPVERQL